MSTPLFLISILLLVPILYTVTYQQQQQPQSAAASTNSDYTRMIWTTTRSSSLLKDMAIDLGLDSGDMIVFHYGPGQVPTTTQINNMKAVTAVSDSNKGFEFFSLSEIQNYADNVAAAGFGFISYNLEHGGSPETEADNPIDAFTDAKAAADAAGIDLHAVPERGMAIGSNADEIADLVDALHYQVQALQGADTTCIIARDSVRSTKVLWESANSALIDDISYQLSFARPAAAGKTVLQTINDCTTRISGTVTTIDGMSPWWTAAAFDSGNLETALAHYKNTYSS
jgi:hypothetical protein